MRSSLPSSSASSSVQDSAEGTGSDGNEEVNEPSTSAARQRQGPTFQKITAAWSQESSLPTIIACPAMAESGLATPQEISEDGQW